MGIPYSREINAAFQQVTPLVAAAYEVLQTTKNIAIVLLFIQIITVALLSVILLSLLGLLYTLNPDLAEEREQLVTPVMHWLASWVFEYGRVVDWTLRVLIVVIFAAFGVFLWQGSLAGTRNPETDGRGERDKEPAHDDGETSTAQSNKKSSEG